MDGKDSRRSASCASSGMSIQTNERIGLPAAKDGCAGEVI
jgi:hypothetical protein